MDTIRALLYSDRKALIHWFSRHSISKVAVLVGFLVLMVAVTWFTYTVSYIFFYNLKSYETYGIETASYLLHAAIIVVLWLAVGSSIVSCLTQLYTQTRSVVHVVSLPVSPLVLASYMYLRSVVSSVILLAIVLGPVLHALSQVFYPDGTGAFWIRSLLVVALLMFSSASIGTIGAYVFARSPAWRHKDRMFPVFGLLFLVSVIGLIQIVFPQRLGMLASASTEEYKEVFPLLPLNNFPLPTRILADTVIHGISGGMVAMVLLVTSFTWFTLVYAGRSFIRAFQKIAEHTRGSSGSVSLERALSVRLEREPILIRTTWLSVVRNTSEVSFMLLIGGTGVFFFGMLWKISSVRPVSESYTSEFVVFVFLWFVFFVTAYGLRLLYPLISRLRSEMWHVGSLPLAFLSVFRGKILFAVLSIVPFLLFSVLLWHLLPLPQTVRIVSILMSMSIALCIAVLHVSLGAVSPDFEHGDQPEVVSTSFAGIVTLAVSLLLGVFFAWRMYLWLDGTIHLFQLVTAVCAVGVSILFFLIPFAQSRIERRDIIG